MRMLKATYHPLICVCVHTYVRMHVCCVVLLHRFPWRDWRCWVLLGVWAGAGLVFGVCVSLC
ncbi:hypothetical protein DL95DRAFT_394101, partial [Leptodontidium sp. 2 PMI_412]